MSLLTRLIPYSGLIKWGAAALAVLAVGGFIYFQHVRIVSAEQHAIEAAEALGREKADNDALLAAAQAVAADAEVDRRARDAANKEAASLRAARAADAAKFSNASKMESDRDPVLAACLALPLPDSLRWRQAR